MNKKVKANNRRFGSWLKKQFSQRPKPLWMVITADVLLIGISLVVFALFHHVLPRYERSAGLTSSREVAAGAQSAIAVNDYDALEADDGSADVTMDLSAMSDDSVSFSEDGAEDTAAEPSGVVDAERCIDMSTVATHEELERAAADCRVFGRVSPEQKKQLVQALQAQGRTVAMVGDGVNDVLALHESDCSVAMGSGSDAARSVAQVVLLDDDFAAVPSIVAEGRRSIFNLQRSAVLFLTKTLYSIALAVLFYLLLKRQAFLFGITAKVVGFLHRIRLMRHPEKTLKKLRKAENEYAECVKVMSGHTQMLLKAFFLNVAQRLSQFLVVVMVYLARGGRASVLPRLLATQCFVTLGSNTVPIPGGMGVADYLMLDGYQQLFGKDEAFLLEMLSRSLSFYICVLTGAVTVLIAYLRLRRRRAGKN